MCCTLDIVHKIFIVSSCSSVWTLGFFHTAIPFAVFTAMYTIAIIFLALIYILYLLGASTSQKYSLGLSRLVGSRATFIYTLTTIHIRIFTTALERQSARGRNLLRLNDWWGEKETQTATPIRLSAGASSANIPGSRSEPERAKEFSSCRKEEGGRERELLIKYWQWLPPRKHKQTPPHQPVCRVYFNKNEPPSQANHPFELSYFTINISTMPGCVSQQLFGVPISGGGETLREPKNVICRTLTRLGIITYTRRIFIFFLPPSAPEHFYTTAHTQTAIAKQKE